MDKGKHKSTKQGKVTLPYVKLKLTKSKAKICGKNLTYFLKGYLLNYLHNEGVIIKGSILRKNFFFWFSVCF